MRKLRGVVLLLLLNSLLGLSSFGQGIIKDDFRVNDDTLKLIQDMPAICVDDLGNLVIVWQDPRNEGWDIFAQRLNLSGDVIGYNFMVNNEIKGNQENPSIASEASGDFIVVWQDSREGNRDIYAQRFNFSGDTLNSNFKINDDLGTKPQIEPEVDFSNKIVMVWEDERLDGSDIFTQLLYPSGEFQDTNFRINDDAGNSTQLRSDLASNHKGDFVVVWQDKREGDYDIYAQRFDSSGDYLGANFKVNNDIGNSLQNFPRVDSDSLGNFVIVWQDKRNGDEDVYAQVFNEGGKKIGDNFRVNDDSGNSYQGRPDIDMDGDGSFVVVWVDKRCGDKDIYAQRYDFDFNPVAENFRVNTDTGSAEQSEPQVATDGNRIYFTWVDQRNGDKDIFAKVIEWNLTQVAEIEAQDNQLSFKLSQNFPNPFNHTTIIPFTVYRKRKTDNSPIPSTLKSVDGYWLLVDRPIHTTLRIYNIKGQLVRTLVDDHLNPGAYTVIWDGRDNRGTKVASGIYFCRLRTEDYIETKKMLLLK